MSRWVEHDVEAKVVQVLADARYDTTHHFGRPFLTAYQLALALDRRWPGLKDAVGYPQVGGRDSGVRATFARYLAAQLSRRILSGDLTCVEGAFLADHGDLRIAYVDRAGRAVVTGLTGGTDELSMFRFRQEPPAGG
jgi:hypothetical protein